MRGRVSLRVTKNVGTQINPGNACGSFNALGKRHAGFANTGKDLAQKGRGNFKLVRQRRLRQSVVLNIL